MAKGDHSDLFMIFKDPSKNLINGDSRADLTSQDPVSMTLLKDFNLGQYFEIERFQISAQNDKKDVNELLRDILKERAKAAQDPKANQTYTNNPQQEAAARKQQQDNSPPVREVTFSRTLESASQSFLSSIKAGVGYSSAALIKRKSVGNMASNDTGDTLGADVYLRIDFRPVLVTSVDWSNDEGEISEDYKFITRKISFQYRPQLQDGTLGAIMSSEWEYVPTGASPMPPDC